MIHRKSTSTRMETMVYTDLRLIEFCVQLRHGAMAYLNFTGPCRQWWPSHVLLKMICRTSKWNSSNTEFGCRVNCTWTFDKQASEIYQFLISFCDLELVASCEVYPSHSFFIVRGVSYMVLCGAPICRGSIFILA